MAIKRNLTKNLVDAVRNTNKHLIKVVKVEAGVEKIIFERTLPSVASPSISFSGAVVGERTVTYKNNDQDSGTLYYRRGTSNYVSVAVGGLGTKSVTYSGTPLTSFTVDCYFVSGTTGLVSEIVSASDFYYGDIT